MRFELKTIFPALLACGFVVTGPALAEEDHSDIEIGHVADQLTLLGIPDEPIFLTPFDLFGTTGWAADDPGFFEVEEVEEGVSPLTLFDNDDIRVELVSLDAGFILVEAGFGKTADSPTEFITLGVEGGLVHSHATFIIDDQVVGTDFEGTLSATFKLVDGNGNYTDSDAFTLEFTNVPEPSSLALLGLGGLALMRRRRNA